MRERKKCISLGQTKEMRVEENGPDSKKERRARCAEESTVQELTAVIRHFEVPMERIRSKS